MYPRILSLLSAIALTPFLLSGEMRWKNKEKKEPICSSPFHAMHVGVRHTEAKGVGYKDGYTTLEGFGIYDGWPSFMPFLDLRGHVFNNGKFAGNVGIGERTVMPSIDHIFGLYLYYDTRQSDHGLKVNQLSPGVEILGKRMEYRINTYFPFGKHKGHRYGSEFNSFSGHQILLQRKRKYAMSGGDAEIGAHITQSIRNDFYIGAGPYYFTSEPNSAWGGKARIYWRYKEYVSLQASYSYDHLFKNIVQGTATLSYPFGPKLKRKGEGCPNPRDLDLSRAAFAPYRFEIPVIRTRKRKEAAINPATGQPWQVWFVNNTSSSNGTFESPFPTLVEAQNASSPNDMIYVFPGDGTTNGMNNGIALKNNQVLFGSGTAQTIATQAGSITIPAFSSTSPIIANPTQTLLITAANHNEISGFTLTDKGAFSVMIGSPGAETIVGLNVHNNLFQMLDGSIGIAILCTGPITVRENTFVGNTATNPGGVFISGGKDAGLLTANVSNNTFLDVSDGIFIAPGTLPSSTTYNATVSGNVVSSFSDTGIFIVGVGNPGTVVTITDNTLLDTRSVGGSTRGSISIDIGGTGLTDMGDYHINNNTIVTSSPSASVNGINLSASDPATIKVSLLNNDIVVGPGAGSVGMRWNLAIGSGTMCSTIVNNNVRLSGSPATTNGASFTVGSWTLNAAMSDNVIPSEIISGTINFVGSCE